MACQKKEEMRVIRVAPFSPENDDDDDDANNNNSNRYNNDIREEREVQTPEAGSRSPPHQQQLRDQQQTHQQSRHQQQHPHQRKELPKVQYVTPVSPVISQHSVGSKTPEVAATKDVATERGTEGLGYGGTT